MQSMVGTTLLILNHNLLVHHWIAIRRVLMLLRMRVLVPTALHRNSARGKIGILMLRL